MSIGTPEGIMPATHQTIHPGDVIRQPGGLALLVAIIDAQEIWSKLTAHQREALRDPDPLANPRTLTSLRRKGLWGANEPTDYGRQVLILGAPK